ncbi:hypothetical protein CHS0354_019860 [Potamilus streckersoni]|nr:hypothetical protein CHS0354_019860 [Potamilus streckersoni]
MQPARLRITELNPHLLCALCGGYLIDATTIVECLHSFCKTCIVRYLEASKYCPICEVLVHKTRPLQNIRLDHTLQDIVYKLVPNLFRDEMKRRRNYYQVEDSVETQGSYSQNGDDTAYQRSRIIYSSDELFSVSLEFCPNGRIQPINKQKNGKKKKDGLNKETRDVRYIQCKAAITVGYLKKFLRLKFSLQENYQVDLFHAQGNLRDIYSLMDVAYIYSWKRKGVMRLYYSIYQKPEVKKEVSFAEGSCSKLENQVDQKTDGSTCYIPHLTFASNNCCDVSLPHDLSPLELIATVAANDLGFTDESRGLKRKAESNDIYNENDDDSNGSIQIKKTIEHAIDLCSKSNNDNGTKCDKKEDQYDCRIKQKIPNLLVSKPIDKCTSGSGCISQGINVNQRNQLSIQSTDWHSNSHSLPEGSKVQSGERTNQANPNHSVSLSVYDYTEEPINYSSNKRSSNHIASNSPVKTNIVSGSDGSKVNSGMGSSSPQKHKMDSSADQGKSNKETSDTRQVTSLYNGHVTPTEQKHQSPIKVSKESSH